MPTLPQKHVLSRSLRLTLLGNRRVPIFEIWHQATRSGTAATVFLTMLLIIALFALNACQEVTSRLTWAFARDNAILGSKLLDRVHPKLQVPVWALLANAFVVLIIGCVYVGSTTAFNAFVGSCLLLQQNSFAIPAALLLWHGRSSRVLPPGRSVRLGAFGWVANIVTVMFALLITVMYCFPVEFPITGSNMSKSRNYLRGLELRITANACVLRLYIGSHWNNDVVRCRQLVCSRWPLLPRSSPARRESRIAHRYDWVCRAVRS